MNKSLRTPRQGPMMRGALAVLSLLAVTALTGCDFSSGNAHDGSKPDPAVKAAKSLTSVLETNSTGQVGFTHGQANCVAKGFVKQFGVHGVQHMGLLDNKLGPGHPPGEFGLSPVQASGAADATLACVNASDFITNLMNTGGGSGGFDHQTVNCIAGDLGDAGTHDLLVAAFEGDQKALKGVLMPAAFSCAMG